MNNYVEYRHAKTINIINKYIKSQEDQEKFLVSVNNAISAGWEIYGELQVTRATTGLYFTQRMAKFHEVDNSDD